MYNTVWRQLVRSIKCFSGARITMTAPLLGAKLAVASFGPRTRKNKTQYLEKVEKNIALTELGSMFKPQTTFMIIH
jgi:hypothetical protein